MWRTSPGHPTWPHTENSNVPLKIAPAEDGGGVRTRCLHSTRAGSRPQPCFSSLVFSPKHLATREEVMLLKDTRHAALGGNHPSNKHSSTLESSEMEEERRKTASCGLCTSECFRNCEWCSLIRRMVKKDDLEVRRQSLKRVTETTQHLRRG